MVEDRTFCMTNAPTTCANSCAGVPCTQTCTVVCGFWYFYRRICSNVASSTCTTTTVATTTTAAATTTKTWPPQLWQLQQHQPHESDNFPPVSYALSQTKRINGQSKKKKKKKKKKKS